jgi:AhpC/TSA family
VDSIVAPPFPGRLTWINSEPLRTDELLGAPVLVEFWDFCRVNSIRTLPYMRAWHERYAPAGLQVIGVHASGFECSADPEAVRAAVARLGIAYPVVLDTELEIWSLYGNLGWPARYLFNQEGTLFEYHYGEGAYAETERAVQELLGISREPVAAERPEDAPEVLLLPQSPDVAGPYSGPYEAGSVWAVLEGGGVVVANGRRIEVTNPGAYELVRNERHTVGRLELELPESVRCHAVCFTPGLPPR